MFSGKIWRLGSSCIGKHLCARVPLALLALDCEHKRMLVMMMVVVMMVVMVVMVMVMVVMIVDDDNGHKRTYRQTQNNSKLEGIFRIS